MEGTYRRLLFIQCVLSGANSLSGIFLVIFFVSRGGFTPQDAVLFSLLGFAGAVGVCFAVSRFPPKSARALMTIGLAALALSYAAYVVLAGWVLLILVALAWGLFIPFFFLPFNALIVSITRREDRARKIASFLVANTLVAIIGPVLGGWIIRSVGVDGYSVVFSLAAGLILLDILLVLRLRESSARYTFSLDLPALGRPIAVALFAEGAFEGVLIGIVPLIAFSYTSEEAALGSLFALFALAGGVMTLALGIWSDRLRNRRPFVAGGAVLSSVAAVLVVEADTIGRFAFAESLMTLTASITPVFLFTMAVERHAIEAGPAIATRELLLNGGRATSLVAAFALMVAGLSAQGAFFLAVVSLVIVAIGSSFLPSETPRYSL